MKGKAIDNYWNGALQNSALEQFISEKDEHALEYLVNILPGDDKQESNVFSYQFVFKANPYFVETTAVRKIKFIDGKPLCV